MKVIRGEKADPRDAPPPGGRDVEIVVVTTLGPIVSADRNPATGTTFTGYSPNAVGQAVAVALMRNVRAGERILRFDVSEGLTRSPGGP